MVDVSLPEPIARPTLLTRYGALMLEGGLAIALGLVLSVAGLGGAAWVLGGIGAGALVFYGYRSHIDPEIQPNKKARKIGQIIIGLTIGLSLQQNDLAIFSSQGLFFLGLPLFLLVCGGLIGVIYARLEQTDLLTAMLATTPGNQGVMASMATDYSKNAPLVSLVQLIRFTSVMLVVPMIANGAIAQPVAASPSLSSRIHHLLSLQWNQLPVAGLMLVTAFLAVSLGNRLKIPVAGFFCAIATGLAFAGLPLLLPALEGVNFQLPPLGNAIGQILLGITIGEYWGMNPKLKRSTVAIALIPTILMAAAALVAAALAYWLTGWDWLTCLLVTAPGGSPEMIWIALSLHHNVEVVTTGHLIRLLVINLSLPLLVSLACFLDRETAPPIAEPLANGSED